MKYNPKIHNRRSIRLKGYDYAQAGLYFVTLCVQNRKCLFGRIEKGEMILNDAGKMVEKWYHELMNKYPDIQCHEMIVMPNHFHCILENVGVVVGEDLSVGADLRVCPVVDDHSLDNGETNKPILGEPSDPILGEPTGSILVEPTGPILVEPTGSILGEPTGSILGEPSGSILGEHVGSPLHAVVQWFKTMSTNEYIRGVKNLGWERFDGKLWQRNYYEHIIRNEKSFHRISNYIANNPAKWDDDKFHSK